MVSGQLGEVKSPETAAAFLVDMAVLCRVSRNAEIRRRPRIENQGRGGSPSGLKIQGANAPSGGKKDSHRGTGTRRGDEIETGVADFLKKFEGGVTWRTRSDRKPFRRRYGASQGLRTETPPWRKSSIFRVASVSPWQRAVAAIRLSMTCNLCPIFSASAWSEAHSFISASPREMTRPANTGRSSDSSQLPSFVRFLPSGSNRMPFRISAMDTRLTYRVSEGRALNHATTWASG
ncbi:MAG: hypothetical protein RL630_634 [Verrucomicrobiota bacterium]